MSGSVKIWVAGVSSSRPRLRRCRRRAPGSRRRDPSHPRQPECTCYFMTVPKRLLWVESDADRADRSEDGAASAAAALPDQFELGGPHHAYPGAGGRRRYRRLGRVRQPGRPLLLPRDDRDLLAPAPGLPGSAGARQRLGDDRRAGGALPARQGEPFRQSGAGDGLLGCARPPRGPAPGRAAGWHAGGGPVGGQPGHRARDRRAVRLDRPILRRGIPPDQAEDRAQARHRGRPPGPRAVSRAPAAGRCELGVHARRRGHAPGDSTASAC